MVQVQMSNLSLQPEICLRVPIKLAVTSDETFPVYSPLTLMTATLPTLPFEQNGEECMNACSIHFSSIG